MKPTDFDFAVFHQPNGKFPMRAGKMLGFTREQIETGWLVPHSRQHLLGRLAPRPHRDARRGQARRPIFMCSYGSGAGSDAFIWTVTRRIHEVQDKAPKTRDYLDKNQIYLEYGAYAKFRRKILKTGGVGDP